jgi:hypothetical protein
MGRGGGIQGETEGAPPASGLVVEGEEGKGGYRIREHLGS